MIEVAVPGSPGQRCDGSNRSEDGDDDQREDRRGDIDPRDLQVGCAAIWDWHAQLLLETASVTEEIAVVW